MEIPGPNCIQTLELHGTICISNDDWENVKVKIEQDHLQPGCEGCYLTLFVNEHGNLALGCGKHGHEPEGSGCPGGTRCCMIITHMPGRGHRAACQCGDRV
jgi:hypothetical protein